MNNEQGNEMVENTYATKDLYFAAFLRVKGMLVKKLEQYSGTSSRNPIYFIFENKKRCEELEDVFWNGVGDDIMINAKEYFATIRDLKSRIFSINKIVNEKERFLR